MSLRPFLFGNDVRVSLKPSQRELKIPIDIATEVIAFTGKRGSGKTHGAKVVVEGLLAANQQVVVGDPQNVWWGLRASKTGKQAGLDVIIFGGDHADQPLLEATGALVADFVIDTGSSIVLSMRHLSKAAMRRFMSDFAERLMERKAEGKHQTPLMLVLDEADIFLPQRIMPEGTRCFSILDDVARRGRSSGMGMTLITQRPAVLNKDVLAMAEVLVAMQTTAPHDRTAILEWVNAHADAAEAKEFLRSLPHLAKGEAWIWSPVLLKVLERIKIIDTITYDSSYTPKVGERRASVKLKPVDMKRLTAELQAVAKELEENKPAKLKARIKELEKQLAAKQAPVKGASREELKAAYREGAADMADRRDYEWEAAISGLGSRLGASVSDAVRATIHKFQPPAKTIKSKSPIIRDQDPYVAQEKAMKPLLEQMGKEYVGVKPTLGGFTPRKQVSVPTAPAHFDGGVKISKAMRKVMTVLAQYGARTRPYVAAHAGYSLGTGHFNNVMGDLRKPGFIVTNGDTIELTPAGLAALGPIEPLPSGDQLWKHWTDKLGKGARQILEVLKEASEPMMRDQVAAAAGFKDATGHFNNCLGDVRSLGPVTFGNPISLTSEFRGAIS